MGRQRLHGHVRGLPAARRSRRRPARPAPRVRHRPDDVRADIARRRDVEQPDGPDRRARRAGPRRGRDRAGIAVGDHDHVHEAGRAQPRRRRLGRNGRCRRCRRGPARRRAHRSAQLALDPVHQRPDRPHDRVPRPATDRRGAQSQRHPQLRFRRRSQCDARPVAGRARDRPHRRDRLGVGADARR